MSQTIAIAPDPAVAAKLAEYDRSRTLEALREAADAAALHDGEVLPDPAAAHTMARARVADWIAILARPKRDLDADFDPDNQPATTISPPGKFGSQYPPGIDPSRVKDPEMRAAYIIAIEKNRLAIKNYGSNYKLYEVHQTIIERAAASVRDAHQTLGMPTAEIAEMLKSADITLADRTTLLAAAR